MEKEEILKIVSDGVERAKADDALQVYAQVAQIDDRGELPWKSHYAFGWIIYYALHQSEARAINERKQMLARYLRLRVAKPHKLHSMILTEAIRLYKDAADLAAQARLNKAPKPESFSIVKFVKLWDLENLRPGDWNRKTVDGNELPSTVEKLITDYTDELYASSSTPSPAFMQLALHALELNPSSASLCAQCSRLYELAGKPAEAVELLRRAILAAPTKFFLWSRLASLISSPDETRLKISLLHKATLCPGPEDFKGRIHLSLAETLLAAGATSQALWELNAVKALYERNGWNLPRQWREVADKIPAQTEPADPTSAYKLIAPLAENFIFEALPAINVSKTFHKPAPEGKDRFGNPGQIAWRVTDETGKNYWLQPARFNIPADLPLGTRLQVKVNGNKILRAILVS